MFKELRKRSSSYRDIPVGKFEVKGVFQDAMMAFLFVVTKNSSDDVTAHARIYNEVWDSQARRPGLPAESRQNLKSIKKYDSNEAIV